ncbi:MAG: hypothetical protein QNJ54_37885 [Prochloraceae cyanobacterium]|nr:hypothetical protein [Prochloraceae cyanobacterium]
MAQELFPSSFKCDCGHESHFFENTVKEMKRMSQNKKVRLGDDSADNHHTIVFYRGQVIHVICPNLGECIISDFE